MDKFIQVVHVGVAAAGTFLSHLLGGWDMSLQFLIYLMIADYTTGIVSAIKNKNLNSEVMYWGGIRKSATLVVIMIAVMLDNLMGNTEPIFRTMAIWYYISREGLSTTENLGKIGVPLPEFIKSTLEQIATDKQNKNQGEDK